jgi:hypothetical protein
MRDKNSSDMTEVSSDIIEFVSDIVGGLVFEWFNLSGMLL